MEWVETTGKTVGEALDAALDQLGVDEHEVEYEIIEEPRGGLFGRLRAPQIRIRARVKPVSREKPGERTRRRRGGSRPGEARPARAERAAGDGATGSDEAARRRGGRAPRGEAAEGARGGPRRRSGRGRGQAQGDGAKKEPKVGESEVPVEAQVEAAEQFLEGLVDAFGLPGRVRTTVDDEDGILCEIEGSDLGLLVGPRGATLQAIEELTRTVVQRRADGHGARLHVDVAGYRAKRREALAAFTRRLVAKAVETGTAQVLEPMPPADRKVVHDTAHEVGGVTTESEGDEPRRRVVIRRA